MHRIYVYDFNTFIRNCTCEYGALICRESLHDRSLICRSIPFHLTKSRYVYICKKYNYPNPYESKT